MATIRRADFPGDANAVLAIWREFVTASPVDLAYQGNDAEFAMLPGKYAAPAGGVLLARTGGTIDGCVAFRRVDDAICEMKRLYVRPHARGQRLGYQLVEHVIAAARAAGYREMRLDVMAQFVAARRLYAAFGFGPAAAISFNPVAGAAFLGLRL